MSKPCISEFGTILKDSLFSNMYVTETTTVCNGSNLKLNGNVVVLNEQSTANATYSITPSRAKTVYVFSGPLRFNTTIRFDVDNSRSEIGDQMIWLFTNAQDSEVTLTGLDAPDYFFTTCGELATEYTIPPRDPTYGNSKFAQYWAFDGTSWIYTSDSY